VSNCAPILPVHSPLEPDAVVMKRDLDLIRNILLAVENNPKLDGHRMLLPDITTFPTLANTDRALLNYNIRLLISAKYLTGQEGAVRPHVSALTWKGHELLDDIRDEGIWDKAKEKIGGLQSVAISVVAEIAKSEIKKHLGLNI
jgi:hypothetical protein